MSYKNHLRRDLEVQRFIRPRPWLDFFQITDPLHLRFKYTTSNRYPRVGIILCSPFILSGHLNHCWLHYVPCMRNCNLETSNNQRLWECGRTTIEGQNAFARSLWFLCNPFHSFLVEVQMKLATYVSCMRNSNLKIRIAGSPCRPQLGYIILLTEPRTVLTMYKMFQNRCYTWFHNN